MEMAQVLEKIGLKKKKLESLRRSSFWELASRIARGETVDQDKAAKLLDEDGKTEQDLQEAVSLCRERQQIHEKLKRLPKLGERRDQINRKLAEEDARLEKASEDHRKATQPLLEEVEQISRLVNEGHALRQRLVDAFPDAELQANLKNLSERVEQLSRQSTANLLQMDNLRAWILDKQRELQITNVHGWVAGTEDLSKAFGTKAEDAKQHIANYERELAQLAAEQPQLQQKIKELQETCAVLRQQAEDGL